MGCLHHGCQRRLDRPLRIGEEGGDAGQRLVVLGIEHVEDRADEQRVAGLFPMVSLFERAFGIDQDVGDVLHVAHFPFAAAHLEQRIICCGFRVGRVEEKDAAVFGAEACGELPVLSLDVMNDGRARPGQQRGHDQADALAGAGRREAQHMLRPVVAQIRAIVAPEHDAIRTEKAGGIHLLLLGPARRAIGLDLLGLSRPPDRHTDCDGDRDESA